MVKQHFILLLMLLSGFCVTESAFADALSMTVEHDTVELGKPIWINIRSDQTRVSLNTLDLSPWQDKLVLPRRYYANLSDDQRSQVMRLKVYPYHTGPLSLPGLYFLSRMNKGINLHVVPARDAKQHSPINFQCRNSTQRPWQRQQVIIACRISMMNAYAVFKQPTMNPRSDVKVFQIQLDTQKNKAARDSMTRYDLGWVITPIHSGGLELRLPPIEYVRDGVVAREFYLPPQHFEVRQTPAWLPGTIPVGHVAVLQYAASGLFLHTGVLNHIRLDMQFDGMPATEVPDYALQLRSDKALRYYATEQKRQMRVDSNGLHQRVIADIPVVATQLGIQRLPDLRLQHFDPSSGTLKTALVAGSTIVVINYWISAFFVLSCSVLLLWLFRLLWRYLLRTWRRFRAYQLAAAQLRQAQSLADVKLAMQSMALAEGWTGNLTFLQWQARMQKVVPLARQLAVSDLNAAAYAQAGLAITPIVQVLQQISKRRRLVLR